MPPARRSGLALNQVAKDDENMKLRTPLNGSEERLKPGRCSGFVKMMEDGNIYWTHTSWCCLFAQSCAITYVIGSRLPDPKHVLPRTVRL